MEEKVKKVLDEINLYLQDEGGNADFITIRDNILYIKLIGACAYCEHKDDTIKDFILQSIQKECPEIKDIINVEL